jgi:hypothetical protein
MTQGYIFYRKDVLMIEGLLKQLKMVELRLVRPWKKYNYWVILSETLLLREHSVAYRP